MRDLWQWPLAAAIMWRASFWWSTPVFLANLWKIADGGWLPLAFAAILFAIMVTWRAGVDAIRAALLQ